MCFACRITDATDPHSEYVIIAFWFSMAISCMLVVCLYVYCMSYWLCEFSALIKFSVDPATGSESAHQEWLENHSMIFLPFCSHFGRDSFETGKEFKNTNFITELGFDCRGPMSR